MECCAVIRAFCSIFLLEFRRFFRSKAFALLIIASTAWMILLPFILKSDGTAEGAREIYMRYSLGGVFALSAIALASSAASSLAREREEKRLQLSMIRPVSLAYLALARIAALVFIGAITLFVSSSILAFKTRGTWRNCWHVLDPVLESASEEAEKEYARYMADPDLPEEIRKSDKAVLIRLLTRHAFERYEAIPPGGKGGWFFDAAKFSSRPLAVRIRFTNDYNIRDDVKGVFSFGSLKGEIDNITQAIAKIPLDKKINREESSSLREGQLDFENLGKNSLMLRPRRDINLLAEADSFAFNLIRANLELIAILASLISLAMFLGAGLGRSVAVFTCITFMFVAVASSDIISEYPDPLESDKVDKMSLAITRAVDFVARPINSLRPLAAISLDECVETKEVVKATIVDILLLPLLFSLLSAFVIAHKEDGV